MRPVNELPYLEWTETSGEVKRIYADVWKQEEVSLPAIVTQHAVESGAKVTDHYRKDPREFRVELFFSGSPIRGDLDPENEGQIREVQLSYPGEYPTVTPFSIRGATKAVEGLFGIGKGPSPPRSISALQFDQPPAARHRAALTLIDRLQTEGILLTVGGTSIRLESLAVTNCIGSRGPEDGDGGRIALDLVQLTFTSSDVAVAVPLPIEARAQSKKSGGNAGDPKAVSEPKKSAAAALWDDATGG